MLDSWTLKVSINMGLGNDGSDKKILKSCIEDLSLISGQTPSVTRFKKSISNFKSRKGFPAGIKSTLRKVCLSHCAGKR